MEQLDSVSYVIRFQYLKEHRNSVRIDDDSENGDVNPQISTEDLSIISTLMCEYMAATSQFAQFGYDYYRYVCGTDEASNSAEEKSCLIPVCSFQPNKGGTSNKSGNKRPYDISSEKNTLDFSDDLHLLRRNDKTKKISSSSCSSVTDEDNNNRAKGLDSYCVKGVDNALHTLSKAGDCLRHCVDLWNWANGQLSQKTLIDHLGGWEKGNVFLKGKKKD